jgi:transcriptional regulator with XRE-family HTH domain
MQQLKLRENISFLRRNKGLTQEQLAEKLGVTNQAVSKWESGQCCPDIILLPEIADIFGVTIDELIGYKNDKSQKNLVLELREQIEVLPKGEDYLFALRIVYALHAIILSKGMTDPLTGNPGWNTKGAIEHAGNGEWGYSCINLPEITTVMRLESVFWSSNKNLRLNNPRMFEISSILRIFGNLRNLKFFWALYELTVHNENAYITLEEISSKCGLSVSNCKDCAEGELSMFLSQKNLSGETLYRIQGMYMQLIPLFSLLSNR